jgi:hypothetical protein
MPGFQSMELASRAGSGHRSVDGGMAASPSAL